jgi:hypothetical protein
VSFRARPLAEQERVSGLVRRTIAVVGSAVALATLGCGPRSISGTVRLEGVPLTEARVTFTGEGGAPGPFVTKTDNDGRYSLLSNTNEDIPAGKYRITISKTGLKDGTTPTDPKELEKAIRTRKIASLVPKVYEDYQTTPLRAEVTSGSRAHDFDLKKKP